MDEQVVLSSEETVVTSIRFLEQLTADYHRHKFAVRLWDGTLWGDSQSPHFTLVIRRPSALKRIFLSSSELVLGEAFIYDDIDIEGNVECAVDFAEFLMTRKFGIADKMRYANFLTSLPGNSNGDRGKWRLDLRGAVHSKERDRLAVTFHYDVSNDFYSLWLDRSMVYSCAYFESFEDDIDKAQEQKLDYICRKLRLKPGETLLDIGCGWAGLLIHAARNYGVRGLGITLSAPQAEWAREKIDQAGLSDQCKVEVCDYRDLDSKQQYDKLVSVGMFEHVGASLLPDYFGRAWRLLRPGGVFLNHGIGTSSVLRESGPSFGEKYVFPDGEIVPINVTLRAAEEGRFEVRDVENLREHYVLTLRQWVRRLEAKAYEARALVGDVMYRIWRLYMSGAAFRFSTGRYNLYQVLLSKPDRGDSSLPLTRRDWYRQGLPQARPNVI